MDLYSLHATAMIHGDNKKEDNVLIHKDHLSSINESKPEVITTPPRKRGRYESTVSVMEATLYSALIPGPISIRLLNQSHSELKEEMTGFLNEDGSFKSADEACLLSSVSLYDTL